MNDDNEIYWKTAYDSLCKMLGCSKIEIGYTNALYPIIGGSIRCFWINDQNSPIRVSTGTYRNIVEAIFNVLKTNDILINDEKILKKGLTIEELLIEGDLNG